MKENGRPVDGEKEYVVCNFCGRDRPLLFFAENGYDLQKCANCGLLYVNPRPRATDSMLSHSHDYAEYVDKYVQQNEIFLMEAKKRLAEILGWKKGGKLLDIGCAAGIFLDYARQQGWEVYGVEPDHRLAQHAIHKLDLNVKVSDFLNNALPAGTFDVIAAHNVISHVRDPELFLREVYRVLKSGGLFFMHTGNRAELSSKKEGEMFGERWATPDHLYHFSEELLREYLERNGFQVRHIRKVHLLDFLFTEENLRTFKGSKIKSLFKMALVKVPTFRKLVYSLFGLYSIRFKGNRLAKLSFVAQK